MGKSSGATFSKIQVDIASNCCQMAKNDRILADERPLEHFLAILAHFMPIYTRIFEKRYRSVEVSERCVASTFLSFRNYLQSRQYKNYECQQSFFSSPLSPLPSLFSPVWFLGSWESKKPGFRCRSGQNGQIFRSHLFKNPGRYCKQLLSDGKK